MAASKSERMRTALIEELGKTEIVSTARCVELLGVSESTVRRLFIKMEESGDAIRVFGGIRKNSAHSMYHFDAIYSVSQEAKRSIGRFAGDLVRSGEAIFIDCGTTTIHMAQRLAERIQNGELENVSIVTNSLTNLETLAPHCKAILVGGTYNAERKSFAGYYSEQLVSRFHFDRCFTGVDSFTFQDGFATADPDFSHLSGLASAKAADAYVLMDASKIGKQSFFVYDRFERIHQVITDSSVTEDQLREFRRCGISVMVAPDAE